MSKIRIVVMLIAIAIVTFAGSASAQALPGVDSADADEAPAAIADPFGRGTPRGLVDGLLKEIAANDPTGAANFLDLSALDPSQRKIEGKRLIETLQALLDQSGRLVPFADLSSSPDGSQTDGLAPLHDRIGEIDLQSGPLDLVASRKERDGRKVWLLSGDTVAALPNAVGRVESGLRSQWISNTIPMGPNILGTPLLHWGLVLGFALLSYVVASAFVALRTLLVKLLPTNRFSDRASLWMASSQAPLRALLAIWIFRLGVDRLGVSIVARSFSINISNIAIWIALAWLALRLTDIAIDGWTDHVRRRGQQSAISVLALLRRLGKALILFIGLALSLRAFGIDVTAVVAALGIGGIAIALGAQNAISDLIGSISLVADRPLRIGDFCRFGETLGTVEDIGIRSTRVRTLERTIVTIPNGDLSRQSVENYTARDEFLFRHTFDLRYETTPDQLRFLLVEIRRVFYAHPKVNPDPARIRLVGMKESSLALEAFLLVRATDYDDFLEVQEDLLLRIMDLVSDSGSGFAFPSQTLYLGRDPGTDFERSEKVASIVDDWRSKGEMQLPRFSPKVVAETAGTLTYPPAGSVFSRPGRELPEWTTNDGIKPSRRVRHRTSSLAPR